ncbi:response regulator [candidate division KSB1 bacterium]
MAIITIFAGSYCNSEEIGERVAAALKYRMLQDDNLFQKTSDQFHMPVNTIRRALHGPPSFFNNITHEKEKAVVFLKSELIELVKDDCVVYTGFAGHLLPAKISHVLRILVIANKEFRSKKIIQELGESEKDALGIMRKNDNDMLRWTHYLLDKSPWDESLYDIVIPMHKYTVDAAVEMITENAKNEAVQTTGKSQAAVADFLLECQISQLLIEKDPQIEVECNNGAVTILINKEVMRLEHFKKQLSELAQTVPGVASVKARIGSKYNLPKILPGIDVDAPSKILLVDDEVEFVHTLSERLKSRNLDASFVYNGEEALEFVNEEEPDVMILDLKMPGIDGIEVLRKVKESHPKIEVIVLTGHGSEKEQKVAEELGAFAYLHKPVDIEVLSQYMKNAYAKIREAGKSDE